MDKQAERGRSGGGAGGKAEILLITKTYPSDVTARTPPPFSTACYFDHSHWLGLCQPARGPARPARPARTARTCAQGQSKGGRRGRGQEVQRSLCSGTDHRSQIDSDPTIWHTDSTTVAPMEIASRHRQAVKSGDGRRIADSVGQCRVQTRSSKRPLLMVHKGTVGGVRGSSRVMDIVRGMPDGGKSDRRYQCGLQVITAT